MKIALVTLLLSIIFSSCGENNNNNFITARESFIKIVLEETVKSCDETGCFQKTFKYTSSGAVVLFRDKTKVVLTAGHSCSPTDPSKLKIKTNGTVEVESVIYGYDINKIKHKFKVHKIDNKEDLCLLISDTISGHAIRLAWEPPTLSETIYNFAAPNGIFAKNMIPLFSGFYSGDLNNMSAYTIPAAQGSSGSVVVNKHGKLVGMIHSVHSKFESFSLSPTYGSIKKFLEINDGFPW